MKPSDLHPFQKLGVPIRFLAQLIGASRSSFYRDSPDLSNAQAERVRAWAEDIARACHAVLDRARLRRLRRDIDRELDSAEDGAETDDE